MKLTPQVERVIAAEGITIQELWKMASSAAITSHERGNRRFHHWLFQINGDTVERMTHFDHRERSRDGTQDVTVFDDCPDCEGEGCMHCGWIGEVKMVYHAKPKNKNHPNHMERLGHPSYLK